MLKPDYIFGYSKGWFLCSILIHLSWYFFVELYILKPASTLGLVLKHYSNKKGNNSPKHSIVSYFIVLDYESEDHFKLHISFKQALSISLSETH